MGDRSQFQSCVLWSTCWVPHIWYGKYLYFWAETNLVNSELCGMLNAGQAAENLAQGWKKEDDTKKEQCGFTQIYVTGDCFEKQSASALHLIGQGSRMGLQTAFGLRDLKNEPFL